MHDDLPAQIDYRISPVVDNDALNALFAAAWPGHTPIDFVAQLREWHAFTCADAFEYPEYTFRKAQTTCWRHAVFQHFNVINIEHHCFVVTVIAHFLLFSKAIQLIDRVVQLREAV